MLEKSVKICVGPSFCLLGFQEFSREFQPSITVFLLVFVSLIIFQRSLAFNKSNNGQTFMFLPMNIVVEGKWMEFSQFCAPCLYCLGPFSCTGDRWYFSDMFFHIFKVLPLHNSQQYGELNNQLHIFLSKIPLDDF